MKRLWTRLSLVLCCVILIGLTWLTCASGGDATDPVVSLSYLSNAIHAELTAAMKARVDAVAGVGVDDLREKRIEALGKLSNAGLIGAASDRVMAYLQQNGKYYYYSDTFRIISLQKDDVVSGAAGTQILLRTGSAAASGGAMIDLSAGRSLAAGGAVTQNARYMLPARDRTGVRITSQSATAYVQGFYRVTSVAYQPRFVAHAQALKLMGLFQGTSTGFNLGKTATRAEAATMLVRLLGEEEIALRGTSRHPFGDVPTWANGYIGHAYTKGYTNGTSAARFTPNNPVSATQYMTFLLRALGYDDAKGDFKWDNALAHAVKIGLISKAEQNELNTTTFYRDQMVYLSYRALLTARKGSSQTLLEYLRENGVVSADSIDSAHALLR